MPTVEIQLPSLHEGQQRVDKSPARYKVIANGRRWGKTTYGVIKCVRKGLNGKQYLWVAPTYKMAKVGWDMLRKIAGQIPDANIMVGDMEVLWPGGGKTMIRSADDPQSLRGMKLDGVVFDEAAWIDPIAWYEAVWPSLLDSDGEADFISTPHGHNWFWELWEKAHVEDDWEAFHEPTSSNPHIKPEALAELRRQYPPSEFAQEFEASFDTVSNLVWDNFDRKTHLHHLSELIKEKRVTLTTHGAFGADFGMTAYSTLVVLQRDTARRVWVREVWARSGGDERVMDMERKRMESKYGKWRGYGDATQFTILSRWNWEKSKLGRGAREERQGLVKGLLSLGREGLYDKDDQPIPALCFDIDGPGVMDLVREIEFYHFERDSKGNLVVCRESHKQDDRITALEYAVAGLEGVAKLDIKKNLGSNVLSFPKRRTA
jgi:hypothetical protein